MLLKFLVRNGTLLISLLLPTLLIVGLQFSSLGKFSDPDGFYHAKASQFLEAGELSDVFPWLAYTTWSDGYANQHYLYHWLLIPFNTIELLPLSIVVFGALFFIALWFLMSGMKIVGKPFWFALAAFGSIDFIFRINIVKANTISLALLCLISLISYRYHKYQNKKLLVLIGLLAGIFTWTYGGFICVPLFLGAYTFAVVIAEKKFDPWPLTASLLGIVFGLLAHPHNSHLLVLLYDQIFQTGLGAGSVVPAGNEWLPFKMDWFLKSNMLILLPWVISMALEIKTLTKRELNWASVWMHSIAIGFLILTLWHRRFVEYWVPFTVLATAITLTPYFKRISWDKFKKNLFSVWQFSFAVVLVGMLAAFIGYYNVGQAIILLSTGEDSDRYQKISQWISDNSSGGDLVLNTQWDQSPQLLYWNHKNYYMVGLDPTFMYLYNEDLYWKWRKIADDEVGDWSSVEEVHNVVSLKLKAKFIFIDTSRNQEIYKFLLDNANSKLFELGFEDEDLAVFKVL